MRGRTAAPGSNFRCKQLVVIPCVYLVIVASREPAVRWRSRPAVTANADSYNDRFAVKGLSGPGWQLDVHTRWGQRVLHTGNYANDWGADAAPGPYYVLLQRPATGYRYKGWVEVVR